MRVIVDTSLDVVLATSSRGSRSVADTSAFPARR